LMVTGASLPNSHDNFSTKFLTTSLSKWEIFKSSTCYKIVHCFPLILALFATHESYGLISKPKDTNRDDNLFQSNKAVLRVLYSAFLAASIVPPFLSLISHISNTALDLAVSIILPSVPQFSCEQFHPY
jgi:hypothetical protein